MTTSDNTSPDEDFTSEINESMVANINHALRTPLNGVMGMTDLLTKAGLNKTQMKYAGIIRESTEMLVLQLENIIEIAKLEDEESLIQNEPCRLKDLVHQSLQPVLVGAVKQKNLITVDCSYDTPEFIRTDSNKLRLILTNLFTCALAFAKCGHIKLRITKENMGGQKEPDYRLRFLWENTRVFHDALERAMEWNDDVMVKDLREFGEITVSLVTAKRLMTALGGVVRFDNLKDVHETPFHFDLVLDEVDMEAAPSAFSCLRGKRVLILQDDILEQNILTQCLNIWETDVQIVSEPVRLMEEIIEARGKRRPFDILIVSKRIEGEELLEAKQNIPHTIVLTADPATQDDVWTNEFSAHLIHPVYPEELLSTLSSFYLDAPSENEKTLAEQASHLINGVEYDQVHANVLIVEDNATNRLYASTLIEGFGCSVTAVENGEYAIKSFAKNPAYDIVFMDCMMPVLDGYNTTRRLRKLGHKNVPIIALTANSSESDREKCLSAGMDDYVTKPVREQHLYSMLKKHFKKKDPA